MWHWKCPLCSDNWHFNITSSTNTRLPGFHSTAHHWNKYEHFLPKHIDKSRELQKRLNRWILSVVPLDTFLKYTQRVAVVIMTYMSTWHFELITFRVHLQYNICTKIGKLLRTDNNVVKVIPHGSTKMTKNAVLCQASSWQYHFVMKHMHSSSVCYNWRACL